jgi:hypothetical protein
VPCAHSDYRQENYSKKLAACPTWSQKFFDGTARRQLLFPAVIISLMGDEPGSFDPVLVSLCVIMEDETFNMQVDGIVSKVRELIICYLH